MAGIVSDGNALGSASLLDDIVCQSLSRSADYIDVHAVDTCADHTS